jgi:BolA-like protein
MLAGQHRGASRGRNALPHRDRIGEFAGLPRVERQRLVHKVLATELAGRVHALILATRTPEEGVE